MDTDTREIYKDMKRVTHQKFRDERSIECAEVAESVLPLAFARPFVEHLLPKGNTVGTCTVCKHKFDLTMQVLYQEHVSRQRSVQLCMCALAHLVCLHMSKNVVWSHSSAMCTLRLHTAAMYMCMAALHAAESEYY